MQALVLALACYCIHVHSSSLLQTVPTLLLQRRLLIGSGALGVAAVTAYSDDLTDLQFDAATAAGHLLKLLDAENAHAFGIWAARHGLVPRERRPDPPCLRTAVWGRTFRNPIGESLLFFKIFETKRDTAA